MRWLRVAKVKRWSDCFIAFTFLHFVSLNVGSLDRRVVVPSKQVNHWVVYTQTFKNHKQVNSTKNVYSTPAINQYSVHVAA